MSDKQRMLDEIVEEHLRLEHDEALDELIATLHPNIVHDVVGFPDNDNPAVGHDAIRACYVTISTHTNTSATLPCVAIMATT